MYKTIENSDVIFQAIFEALDLSECCLEHIVSFADMGDFSLDSINSIVIGASIGILAIVVKPFILLLEESKDFWFFCGFCESLMRST